MKVKKLRVFITAMLGSIVLSLSVPSLPSVAEEAEEGAEIIINISPEDMLFDVDNMKPGDWAPRTAIIQNNGATAFEYVTTVRNDSETEKLFNELLLEVSDEEEELYNGKLADFNGLSPRSLEASNDEELTFIVRFPTGLGNDFQGLAAQFSLIFSAAGEESQMEEEAISAGTIGSSGGDGAAGESRLPDTATNMFNLLLIGGVLLVSGGLLIVYNRRRMRKADKPV